MNIYFAGNRPVDSTIDKSLHEEMEKKALKRIKFKLSSFYYSKEVKEVLNLKKQIEEEDNAD